MDGNAGTKASSLADQVTHLSDTIHACERLCLLSARTVVRCAVDLGDGPIAPQAFIPSLTRDLHSAPVKDDANGQTEFGAPISASINRHSATSAQCIAALQALVPVVGRFQLGTPESKGLAFRPIERTALKGFEPDRVCDEIRATVIAGLDAFCGPAFSGSSAPPPAAGADAASAQPSTPTATVNADPPAPPVATDTPAPSPTAEASAGSAATEGSGNSSTDEFASLRLSSTSLGYLHPFTAVQVLRALAPSKGLFGPVWWRSLFIILWFINRRAGSLRSYPNTQATQSPGTAFLGSKCVDAIEAVYEVFARRRNRFERLTTLVKELKGVQDSRRALEALGAGLITHDNFGRGYAYKGENLVTDIEACIREIASDTALPRDPASQSMYQHWNGKFEKGMRAARAEQKADATEVLILVVETLVDAIESKREQSKRLRAANESEIEGINAAAKEIRTIYGQIDNELNKGARKRVQADKEQVAREADPDVQHAAEPDALARKAELEALVGKIEKTLKSMQPSPDQGIVGIFPNWICSTSYWEATSAILKGNSRVSDDDSPHALAERENHLRSLGSHWRRHCDASDHASKTLGTFKDYVNELFEKDFEVLARDVRNANAAGKSKETVQDEEIELLVKTLSRASQRLSRLHEHLWRYIETGVRWAEILMHRHLTYAASGAMTQFDANELAHAVRVVCRDGNKLRFNTILTALRVVCESQRPDGTWSCQQPFYWTETGQSASTLSVETALAVVSTVNVLLVNPERFGASLEEVSAGLQSVYDGLDRFFHWLSGSIQSFPVPPELTKSPFEPQAWVYGWCSDRVHEPGRIHSWVTAIAIEFLVEFRRLLQVRINSLLRAEFLSHHPFELGRLSEVEPTDLANFGPSSAEPPVVAQLLNLLRPHKALELAEGPWLPSPPPEGSIAFWSGILYGPPGTSKTFLAKAIAGELSWPLISLSPSDFLARGEQDIESRASEIFSSLSAGSRLVYFFDEIDELIRDRGQMERERRSVFSFLTPSFLTKLQDFRDQAKKNEFIFILGTNYFDRIDAAAKRSGRIDRSFVVAYPDLHSRSYIILRLLLKALAKNKGPAGQFDALREYLQSIQQVLGNVFPKKNKIFVDMFATFSGFLSYPKMKDLSDRLIELTTKKTEGPHGVMPDVTAEKLKRMIGELHAVARGTSTRFKPEISLAEYAERPDIFDDEVVKVVASIPSVPFPWPESSGTRKKSAGKDVPVKVQLRELFQAIKRLDKKVQWEVKSKYEALLSNHKHQFPFKTDAKRRQ
jgi:hypothetical protein